MPAKAFPRLTSETAATHKQNIPQMTKNASEKESKASPEQSALLNRQPLSISASGDTSSTIPQSAENARDFLTPKEKKDNDGIKPDFALEAEGDMKIANIIEKLKRFRAKKPIQEWTDKELSRYRMRVFHKEHYLTHDNWNTHEPEQDEAYRKYHKTRNSARSTMLLNLQTNGGIFS